jgi:ABC-type transporter Mla subunit MlaD
MSGTVRLGIFIVATLTVLAIGVFLIGNRQFMFSSTYKLNAEFKSVSD